MKTSFLTFIIFTSLLFSQEMPEMNAQNMGKMMQEMQTCMAKVDFNSLASLEEKSLNVQKKIEEKCSQGKKDEATHIALEFITEIKKLPAIIQMQKCSKDSPIGEVLKLELDEADTDNICNGEKSDFGLPNKQRVQW